VQIAMTSQRAMCNVDERELLFLSWDGVHVLGAMGQEGFDLSFDIIDRVACPQIG